MLSRKIFFILLAMAAVVYALNLAIDVMEVDAAQYAEMSWEMLTHKSYLQLYCLGTPYLDKPPLLFWLNTLSFALLGISNFSYKLPSLLFAVLAVYATWRLALLHYGRSIANTAAIMLATTQAVFLITNDVRTDTMLMGAVIFAIWQLAAYFENGRLLNLCLGGLGIGLAMLAKGPIGLIAVGAAFFPYLFAAKKWRAVFSWKTVLPLFIIALLLVPMSVGLFEQWGIKGLRFYYWTQSFGRITGESEWNNHPDTFFLVHTTAWAFLPWSLFLFGGWLTGLVQLVKSKFRPAQPQQLIPLAGFTLVLIALMLSKYQLPHYIFVVYPLGAIMAARFLQQLKEWGRWRNALMLLQVITLAGLIAVSVLLQFALKGVEALSLLGLAVLYPAVIFLLLKVNMQLKWHEKLAMRIYQKVNTVFRLSIPFKKAWAFIMEMFFRQVVVISAGVIIVFNILLSGFYFPEILKYQGQNDLARYVQQHIAANNNFVTYGFAPDFSTVYYAQHMPAYVLWQKDQLRQALQQKGTLLAITTPNGIEQLKADGIHYRVLQEQYTYKVSRLTVKFLSPATRPQVCEKLLLVEARL